LRIPPDRFRKKYLDKIIIKTLFKMNCHNVLIEKWGHTHFGFMRDTLYKKGGWM
jgi:hypothetical protein